MFNGYRIFLICSLLVMLKSQHGVINNMAPHIGNPEFQRNPHHMENNFQPPHPGNAQDIPNHHSHHHRHNNHHPKGAQEIQQGFTNNSNSIFSGYMGTIYEILMVFFFFNFIYNCFYGNKQNDKNALIWYNANKQYFEERYKQIGLNDNYEEDTLGESLKELKDNATDLIKESPQVYKFYASNYRYVKQIAVVLEFKKKTDASSLLVSFILPTMDRIAYQVVFNSAEQVGWVFSVCKKKDAKYLKQSYADLNFFGQNYDPSFMNERYTLLAESQELFIELFQNKTLLNYYKIIENTIDVIYCTDQETFCKEKFSVFFSFELNLSRKGQEALYLQITHFVNLFIDTLAQIKPSHKLQAEFNRNRVQFERTKMEAGQRKEIEDKERKEFIEQWKLKNKMKNKKPWQKVKKDKENK